MNKNQKELDAMKDEYFQESNEQKKIDFEFRMIEKQLE